MRSNTKSFLKDAFGSLISNDKAISAAKASPWWLTIVLFFVGIIIPIIPMTVSAANTKGSQAITTYSYNMDKVVPYLSYQMAKDNKQLVLDDNHEIASITADDMTPAYHYENTLTGMTEFEIFFSSASTEKEKTNYVKNYCSTKHKKTVTNDEGETQEVEYNSSFLVFFKNGSYLQLFTQDGTQAIPGSSFLGDYKKFAAGTDLVKFLIETEANKTAPTTEEEILVRMGNSAETKEVFNNFKTFLNKSYANLKVKNTWLSSLIYLGVYAGLSLLMSFLIWLLTRGKANPFNYLSILVCFKIGTWCDLCPALIGLVLGFLIPKYAIMFFIMPVGLRIMYLSMKQLRPNY